MKLALAILLAIVVAAVNAQTGNEAVDGCANEDDAEVECMNALGESDVTASLDCVSCWAANVGAGLAEETCAAIATCTECEVCADQLVSPLSCIGAGFGNPQFTCVDGVPVFDPDGDAGGDGAGDTGGDTGDTGGDTGDTGGETSGATAAAKQLPRMGSYGISLLLVFLY